MMWMYKQPGFALRLLCELQKQQQCSVHCDTLLQTEGVSIPAHSCVLSALSPVFCRAFANAPSLPVGQSRLVQLEAVGAHALLKLVGFMYSGEIEGESLDEQQEVINIAYKLGFRNFMVGKQKQVNRHQNKTASWREIGLQTEETGGRKKDASIQILSEKQSFSHSGTQTESTEADFADTCIASEPEVSIDLPEELTDVPSEYNSISPDAGLAWIDEIVAHSPSNSAEALVRVQAKPKQTQKEKKRAKISKKGGTQISLKIKLKRQRSGALWEIVSVEEESTVDGSKPCGSSDDPPMTHSLAETHKRSVEVQLSPSHSLTCQNLETVTLTPPSELTTPLPATPTRPPSEYFHLHIPDPVPLSTPLQMPPLLPGLSQPEESDEHIAKLLEMVTVGLNSLPSVTVEGDNSMHAHLDHKLEKCAAVANSPASYLCLLGHNLGAMGSGTTSGTSEEREAGSEDLSSCRKWDLKNVASVASYPALLSYTSPCMTQKKNIDSSFTPSCPVTDIVPSRLTFGTEGHEHQNVVELKTVFNNFFCGADTYVQSGKQTVSEASEESDIQTQISRTATSNAAQADPTPVGKQCPEQLHVTDQVSAWQSSDVGQAQHLMTDNWADFSEMRLPRCLSPLTLEAGETTGMSAQDPLRPLEFSSCLSASHVNHQPALRYTSSPIQPQALPGKTNQQNPSCTSLHVNELQCSVVGKNSCPLRSNRDHNGEASECKSEEKKTKMTDFENDLLKGTEDNILDRQMNESVVRGISTASHSVETVNEPYRKKAKMAGYPNGVDTQTVKVVNPCSEKIKNIRHIDNTQDISNSVPSEKMNCLKAAKARKTVSVDLKSQENVALCQISQSFKCKRQEACQKDDRDAKQPASLVAKRGRGRPLQKRSCDKTLMEDLSEISKLNSTPAVLNALSSSSHHDIQLTQMSKECVPRHVSGSPLKVEHPLGLAQTTTKVKDLINECEKNKIPEPEMEKPIEPEKVIPDVNLNREENKQLKSSASLSKKASFCDKIFHQSIFSVGTTVTQHFPPINHQLRSILQTTDRKIRTSLPSSLMCKKLREPPEPDHMSTKLTKDNNKQEKKDTTEECEVERGVRGTDKPDEVLDKSKDNKVDSENRDDSEQDENSSINVNGCLVNGNFLREADTNANTGISIHDSVDLNAAFHLCTIPPARDFNNNFGMENNSQQESTTTLLHPFRPENMMEKPKTDEQITESLCEVPVSNEPTEIKLIKTKELHLEGTGSTQIGNMEGQEVWKKEKENEKTVRKPERVEISRMNEYEAGISDVEVDVMDESTQLATGRGDEVVATGADVVDIDVEESQMSVEMDNDGEALAHEEELNGQQVLRTEVEVMPPDEATVEMTSEVLNPEASSIRRGEEPDLSSASVDTLGSSAVFLPDVNTESAEDCSSAEEELVVDDISDSPLEPCTIVGTQCNTILEEEDELNEEEEGEEEEEEVDVTGEESN
ncbi:hypothetical protein PHYPO_G00176190 [Pangasianodon hypophthalmus]|uniref:BTB domain-containing protein n=1 Tax=Pangasianodon hypophthalmus TaxID=310915 RepID=A0A5N5PRS2_PANHP|nr:hypothetical protein PHYPO_G00176190 [Pangasianodon hypophthalmus]